MRVVRTVILGAVVVCAAACAQPDSSPAPANATPPALTDIPVTPGRAPTGAADMRTLEPFTGDLDVMLERGVVRVLAAPSGTHFHDAGGMQRGRTVDAAVAFEQFLNRRLAPQSVTVMVIASSDGTLVADLLAGHGDIGANLLRTFERDDQVAFATPVRTGIREIVVTAPGAPLVSLEDVGGRAIHVRRNSDHHASLMRLNDQLKKIDRPPARIVLADESHTDELLLGLVNDGRVPATIVDDYIYDARQSRLARTAVNRDVAVSQDGVIAWVTRKESVKLLAFVNEFFTTRRLSFAAP